MPAAIIDTQNAINNRLSVRDALIFDLLMVFSLMVFSISGLGFYRTRMATFGPSLFLADVERYALFARFAGTRDPLLPESSVDINLPARYGQGSSRVHH
jgi:hypothetical protein